MAHEQALLEDIKRLIKCGKYRIRIHAIRHMIEEGFNEEDIIETVTGRSKILEDYSDEFRCLIWGRFHFTDRTTSPLHIVCEYPRNSLVDIVTAYIPQKPWWISPMKR